MWSSRLQKWLYERFGVYIEDFRFQPEESTVEAEEPLSAKRWVGKEAEEEEEKEVVVEKGLNTSTHWLSCGWWWRVVGLDGSSCHSHVFCRTATQYTYDGAICKANVNKTLNDSAADDLTIKWVYCCQTQLQFWALFFGGRAGLHVLQLDHRKLERTRTFLFTLQSCAHSLCASVWVMLGLRRPNRHSHFLKMKRPSPSSLSLYFLLSG